MSLINNNDHNCESCVLDSLDCNVFTMVEPEYTDLRLTKGVIQLCKTMSHKYTFISPSFLTFDYCTQAHILLNIFFFP